MDIGQIEQLANRLLAGERRLGFGDFAELAIVAFDGVGGVNQAPDFCGVVEEGGQLFPVIFPGPHGDRVLVTPFLTQFD